MFTRLNDKGMSSAGKVSDSKDIAGIRRPQGNAAKKLGLFVITETTSNRSVILHFLGFRVKPSGSIVL
jgi:hypothetical protein